MRTSKVSRDTARLIAALSTSPRKTRSVQIRKSRLSNSAEITSSVSEIKQEEDVNGFHTLDANSVGDISDGKETELDSSASRKRKRSNSAVATSVKSEASNLKQISTSSATAASPSKARRQPAKRVKQEDGSVKVEPPTDWETTYNLVKQMRQPGGAAYPAVVDTQGCAHLHDEHDMPLNQRFQTLISLMLSSQTKDTVTAAAVHRLKTELPGGLNLKSILEVDPKDLDEKIGKVGFHNTKTKFIKQTAVILRDKWHGDIPDSPEGLTSLPGVGPKMAYLCLSAAWGKHEGIGVDVHVHRITNLWGWHGKKTNTPEETRKSLQAWLPRDKWHEINGLLVGLGQAICTPVGRKCERCLLAEKRICPARLVNRGVVREAKREVKIEGGEVDVSADIKLEEADITAGSQDIEDIGVSKRTRLRVVR